MASTNNNNVELYKQIAAYLGKFINDETSLGKSGKVALWSGASVIVLAILTAITGNPALFAWHSGLLVIVANVLLVFVKNLLDSQTPNV
jgi:hypothetical protein